ncbi:MAG: T9SS type A sorting domain-containing protein [candidate division KSB1 bacterium]|nr:T9SS type A sorting domain-containing protein [candidate division KSB1 bacterium]
MRERRKWLFTAAMLVAMTTGTWLTLHAQTYRERWGDLFEWGKRPGPGWEVSVPDTLVGVLVQQPRRPGALRYGLDTNGDQQPDYYLNLGRVFPQDSLPQPGSEVTVIGWVRAEHGLKLIVVQSINGLQARPLPNWYRHVHQWLARHDSITITGTVLADTVDGIQLLFLDADGDGVADYFLDFGPPWYVPESGASRPVEGQTVTVVGFVEACRGTDVLVVLSIDGQAWREPFGPPPWTGRWMRIREAVDTLRIVSPWDSLLEVVVPPGAFRHMRQTHARIFCQLYPALLDSLPALGDSVFAGWRIRFFAEGGVRLNGRGLVLHFAERIRIRLRIVSGKPGTLGKASTATYTLATWDEAANRWVPIGSTSGDAIVGEVETLNSDNLALIQAATATGLSPSPAYLPTMAELYPNYPNPFNPSTVIGYRVNGTSPQRVKLAVYDLTGRPVSTIVSALQEPGEYRFTWTAIDEQGVELPAGVYIVRLEVGGFTQARRIVLVK